jgi:polyisoprenoid-binding protein YceI
MKHLLIVSLLTIAGLTAQAQKIFQTKSGKVSFYSAAPLENIEAVNNLADSKLSTSGQVTFIIPIKGFRFANATMEDHFNENYMESDKYPKAMFLGTITNIKDIDLGKDGTYTTSATGTLEIHGQKRTVIIAGTIEVKQGKPVIKTKFKVKLADYNIKGAWIDSKIAKEIEITVDCKYA